MNRISRRILRRTTAQLLQFGKIVVEVEELLFAFIMGWVDECLWYNSRFFFPFGIAFDLSTGVTFTCFTRSTWSRFYLKAIISRTVSRISESIRYCIDVDLKKRRKFRSLTNGQWMFSVYCPVFCSGNPNARLYLCTSLGTLLTNRNHVDVKPKSWHIKSVRTNRRVGKYGRKRSQIWMCISHDPTRRP